MTKTESNGLLHVGILALLLGLFLLPTLGWRDFCDGMENFNVLTAIECARDGHWLIPTSNGLPRLVKPPLTSWVTGLGIMAGGPFDVAHGRQMEFAARWPSLVIAWVMLVAVYGTGRLLRNARFGLDAAIICGTTLFFLRYSGRASYDMQLAAWVTVCNFFIVLVMVRGMWGLGCAGAGVSLGLALMTKGPVGLIWTIVPLAAWGAGEWLLSGRKLPIPITARQVKSVAGGVALVLLIGLPWVIYVYVKAGPMLGTWINEVRLEDETLERSQEKFGEGLICLAQLLPWTPLVIAGMFGMKRGMGGISAQRIRLFSWTIILPLIIVSCVPPVRDRYLLPMAAPAAILAAIGLAAMREVGWLAAGEFLAVAGLALGMPAAGIMGATGLRTLDGTPMFHPLEGTIFCAIIALLLAISLLIWRKRPKHLVLAWGVVLFASHMEVSWGSRLTPDGYSTLKRTAAEIEERWPDAQIYAMINSQPPRELAIYMHHSFTMVRLPEDVPKTPPPPLRLMIRKRANLNGDLMSVRAHGDVWHIYDANLMNPLDAQGHPGLGGQGD